MQKAWAIEVQGVCSRHVRPRELAAGRALWSLRGGGWGAGEKSEGDIIKQLEDVERSTDPSEIVNLMASCQASARVQREGCKALCDLATLDASRPSVVAHGGVEAVVQAMRRHTGSEEIQEQGCLTLGNIAFR